ncbi:MAG: hypothetical protein EWV81_22605 [Microcystis aeruginosa Ma_SC_T_19800800_S464]|uniref:Uncharacterized protein n=1 Tax=Microcystis aeruginosa Ma_SC_T_19800800_S464 TaxID=2486257 RepID=A0A552DDG6_MICAE|nr:MAG: hypothetical protein EWV81_22605 [Microcystis aeruginosa Ma_SC_T_19800800_S464]
MGVGVWGFTHFQVVNYLIFREKVPEFSPQSRFIQQTLNRDKKPDRTDKKPVLSLRRKKLKRS